MIVYDPNSFGWAANRACSVMGKLTDIGGKVQTNAASYPYFVITSLVGIKGTNRSAVLDYIILDWIRTNQPELDTYGITFSAWQKAKATKDKEKKPIFKLHEAPKGEKPSPRDELKGGASSAQGETQNA